MTGSKSNTNRKTFHPDACDILEYSARWYAQGALVGSVDGGSRAKGLTSTLRRIPFYQYIPCTLQTLNCKVFRIRTSKSTEIWDNKRTVSIGTHLSSSSTQARLSGSRREVLGRGQHSGGMGSGQAAGLTFCFYLFPAGKPQARIRNQAACLWFGKAGGSYMRETEREQRVITQNRSDAQHCYDMKTTMLAEKGFRQHQGNNQMWTIQRKYP